MIGKGEIEESFNRLKEYCEGEDFKGWDPYDGLNSRVFNVLPFRKSYIIKLTWIQLFRRNPVNLRKILRIDKGWNPKGLGLFLSGYCKLYNINPYPIYLEKINFLINRITERISKGYSGACWGYNFDWQAKAFFQPENTPTIVATSFISNSLLDAYKITGDEALFDIARSSCDFILHDLNRTYDNNDFAFSYSPIDNTTIFNASLLGSKLLARVYKKTGEPDLLDAAKKSVSFCTSYQNSDGSWTYGTLPHHQWIDNFHTGYNLECLADYQRYSNDFSFSKSLEKGTEFYLKNLFTIKGEAKNHHDKVYPIDMHSPAQLIITLFHQGKLTENKELVDRVIQWSIQNMQNKKGYFYYKKFRFWTNKISYIRWVQAWMFYGLSTYLLNENK